MVQWLRLHASDAGDVGLIPGQGTKIPHAMGRGQKEKKIRVPSKQNIFFFLKTKCIYVFGCIRS